jgi:hypothetical protein
MSLLFSIERIHIPFYIVLLIGSSALAFFSYRNLRGELRKAWLILFIALRSMLFFLIFSSLFSVVLEIHFSKQEKPLLMVLLDSSGSMDETESTGTRSALAKQYLHEKLLPQLGNRARIELLLFSDNIYEQGDTATINKGVTMIGSSLNRIQAQSQIPSAVFLLSDGRNTSGDDPVEVAERLSFPVYSVKIGEIKEKNNLLISAIRVNPIVYSGDSVPVSVVLGNSGIERKEVSVTLRSREKVIAKSMIPAIAQGVETPLQLIFVPAGEGLHSYELSITTFENESSTEDNHRSFSVRVIEKRKKVLLIAFQMNWDYRFLREFLNAQEDIESHCYARVSNDYFIVEHLNEAKKGKLGTDALLSADITILINPKGIAQDYYVHITKRVFNDGMGLLILGNELPGFSAFKESYPFVLSTGARAGDVLPVPTKEGRSAHLLELNGKVPEAFPPLSNPLQIRTAKSTATVYLESSGQPGESATPLFASINYGKGKIAAFAAENLWHWKTLPYATKTMPSVYDNMMNNILKWLIARKEGERLVLHADRTKILWGEPLSVSAALYDEMMNPLEGGVIVLKIAKDGVAVGDFVMKDVGEGNYERSIPMLEPGKYTVCAEARFPEAMHSTSSFSFEVEAREIEKLTTEPNHLLLRNIAQASGGKCLNRDAPLSDLHLDPSMTVARRRFHFARGILPLLFITALFFAELFLRKRKGLR